jgi:hypothetical protein
MIEIAMTSPHGMARVRIASGSGKEANAFAGQQYVSQH